MRSIIETIETGVSSRIPQHQVRSSSTHAESRKGDSFAQVLKHPETQRKIQPESENTSKSIAKGVKRSSENKDAGILKVDDLSKEQEQVAVTEVVNSGILEAKQDKELAIDSASEALLPSINEGQQNTSVIVANSLIEVEGVVVVPTKAAKGGNSLPVIEPKQPVPVSPLPIIQSEVSRLAKLTIEPESVQAVQPASKNVVMTQPVEALAKTTTISVTSAATSKNGIFMPIATVAREHQVSEIDLSQNNVEIKKLLSQTSSSTAVGKEFNLAELNLSELLNKYSAINNKAFSNRMVNVETLTDIRAEAKAETQPISAVSTNALSTTSPSAQRTEASPLSFTMQTAYKLGSREWSESFTRNIALMALNNNKSVEIRMDPPDLGSIQVKFSQLVNETNIQFQVQHTETRQAIEASIQRLKDALAEQGFVNINVDIQQREQSQSEADRSTQDSGLKATSLTSDLVMAEGEMALLQPIANTGIDFFA